MKKWQWVKPQSDSKTGGGSREVRHETLIRRTKSSGVTRTTASLLRLTPTATDTSTATGAPRRAGCVRGEGACWSYIDLMSYRLLMIALRCRYHIPIVTIVALIVGHSRTLSVIYRWTDIMAQYATTSRLNPFNCKNLSSMYCM